MATRFGAWGDCGIVSFFDRNRPMQLTRDAAPDANIITGLAADGLRIRERVYTGSLIVSADTVIADWPVTRADALTPAHILQAAELAPQIVLFGSGDSLVFPDPAAFAPLYERGVGVEVMDTAAACRTYNVLLGEGRKVVAALIVGQ